MESANVQMKRHSSKGTKRQRDREEQGSEKEGYSPRYSLASLLELPCPLKPTFRAAVSRPRDVADVMVGVEVLSENSKHIVTAMSTKSSWMEAMRSY